MIASVESRLEEELKKELHKAIRVLSLGTSVGLLALHGRLTHLPRSIRLLQQLLQILLPKPRATRTLDVRASVNIGPELRSRDLEPCDRR